MSEPRGLARLHELADFDAIIDVRSPAEFAEDHVPGAINCPVLDDAQRAQIGTLYVQDSPFVARRLGAALVAQNIARHLLDRFQDKPKDWRPLIYCWRGGQRSGSFTLVLRQIGWDACQLAGGYKRYRQHVVNTLTTLPQGVTWRVLCGPTGSGKTRLLHTLAAEGAQVLDLEGLAMHRGSVLGAVPGHPQPSQKAFETALVTQLLRFDPQRPVFVEAESRKIGRIHLPESLIDTLRRSPCFVIEATRSARIAYLLHDYAYMADDPSLLQTCLDALQSVHSKETLSRWRTWAADGALDALLTELLERHYDPLYARSQNSHFAGLSTAPRMVTDSLDPEPLRRMAQQILKEHAT